MISRLALYMALAAAPITAAAAQDTTKAPDTAAAPSDKAVQDIIVTGKFVDTGAKSAMKMDIRVLDTPVSVQSYSNAFVKSLNVLNLSDLYNYMTGVKKSGVTAYDITIRGFKSSGDDRNAIMVDGLPGLTGRYTSPPTIGIDHVELVKGPMSVLYGQIQPGGFVNMITKKPSDVASTMIEMRGQTYAADGRPMFNKMGFAGAIDSTGPLFDGVDYRITGQVTRNNTFRAYNYTNQEFIQPSVRFKLGERTTVTGQFEYRHTREHFDIGLAAPFDGATLATSTMYDITQVASRYTVYTQPDNYRDEDGKSEAIFVAHRLGGDWRISASFRNVDYFSDQQDISSSGINRYGGIMNNTFRVTRRARQLQTTRRYDYGDLNLSGTFHTFGIENKILVGINGGVNTTRNNRIKFFNGATRSTTTGVCPAGGICLDVDLYNPDYTAIPAFSALPAYNTGQATGLTDQNTEARNYGIYVSDLMTLTPWLKVTWAVRNFSEYQNSYPDKRNTPTVFSERTNNKAALPSAGILIEPSRNITFYGSYSQSFVPPDPGTTDANNQYTFHPITAKQYEIGVKTQNLFHNRLGFTAALYRIEQNGQITNYICPAGSPAIVCSVQVGTTRADGFELEGNATPLPGWNIIAGYSHVLAKVIKSIDTLSFQTGRVLPNVAKDAANLWTRYDLRNGLGFGLGITYTGDRQGILPTVVTQQQTLLLPHYTIVDAGLYYVKGKWSFDLKAGNLFDKIYYESSGGGSQGLVQITPGAPRNITLTARLKI